MEFHLLSFFTFLSLALAVTHAALPAEVYWNKVLPNTPMPNVITDLLKSAWTEDKSTAVGVGKGGVFVGAGKPGKRTNVGVTKGGVAVNTGRKGKPIFVGVHPGSDPFQYFYASKVDQLQADPNTLIFFFEKDLHVGKKMNLHFFKTANDATVLPRQIAKSIPFSSNKFPEILNRFLVEPESEDAKIMKHTVKQCEDPAVDKEVTTCATSLESMIDFTTSQLGKNVRAISTEVGKETQKQTYTIVGEVKKVVNDKSVICHKKTYVYAVFYCHSSLTSTLYSVPLVGVDGTKVNAIAACHTDTSAWNPKHVAFQLLKVKPGTVPICHFIPQDHIVWAPY